MKRITGIIAAVAIAALSVPVAANAADRAVKARKIVKAEPSILAPEPMMTWSGFYVGISGGWGWGSTDHTVTVGSGLSSGDFDVDGGILGGSFGYNQQFGPWVFGFETDVNKTWIDGSTSRAPTVLGLAIPLNISSELTWLGTVRGRVGYDYNSWLLYVTGGAAFGNVTSTVSTALLGIGATAGQSDTRLGWTIGGGVEHKFTPNLSGKLEYLYVDLGQNTQLLIDNVGFTTNIFRVGVNYRLGDLVH